MNAFDLFTGKLYPETSPYFAITEKLRDKGLFDYYPWCYVQTNFYSYIKVVVYANQENCYNNGCKYIPYSEQTLQTIKNTFERQVTLTYNQCTVITTQYREHISIPWKKKG